MTLWLLLPAAYLAVAVYLFVTRRGRWVRWQRAEFPSLGVAGSWFAWTCVLWPIWYPLFLVSERDTFRKKGKVAETRLDRFVERGDKS